MLKMSKNKKMIIGILIAVLIIVIGIVVVYKVIEKNVTNRADFNFTVENISSKSVDTVNQEQKTTVELDESNKYIITTDFRWKTMMNDGGSNTNIYYEIDLDNNSVNKITESYHANLGGTPKTDKELITIKIDNKLSKELSTTLNEIFQSKDINNTNNYNFYTIEKQNEEKNIYNEDNIKILKELINKIEGKR